jgi:hypothetical protein
VPKAQHYLSAARGLPPKKRAAFVQHKMQKVQHKPPGAWPQPLMDRELAKMTVFFLL